MDQNDIRFIEVIIHLLTSVGLTPGGSTIESSCNVMAHGNAREGK